MIRQTMKGRHPSWLRTLAVVPIVGTLILLLSVSFGAAQPYAMPQADLTPMSFSYLPLVAAAPGCPATSPNEYASGTAFQYDTDDPVRPARLHADKNIELRGYTPNTDPSLVKALVDYGCDDPDAPQLASLQSPHRVPPLARFYRVNHWEWHDSPDPGVRAEPIIDYPVTALGLGTTPGQTLHVPYSGYSIGGGMEVLVLFADRDTITLRYTRDDSAAPAGYTLHIDNICTDPNLLALYEQLDDPEGPRYDYPSDAYALPTLYAGQPVGVARGDEAVIAIADAGTFQDPRSLNEFWRYRPGYPE